MSKPQNFAELLAADKRYKREAYGFVFEALRYAHDILGLGTATPSEPGEQEAEKPTPEKPARGKSEAKKGELREKRPKEAPPGEESAESPRHLTGRELCGAIRTYALDQFGFMAKTVLNSWGVHTTSDFGEIVFNLIEIGEMSKTKEDRKEDFSDIFDFETELRRDFRIEPPKA